MNWQAALITYYRMELRERRKVAGTVILVRLSHVMFDTLFASGPSGSGSITLRCGSWKLLHALLRKETKLPGFDGARKQGLHLEVRIMVLV